LKKRVFIVLSALPVLVLVLIFYFNRFNRIQIREKFQEITFAEGLTIGSLVEVSGRYLAEEGTGRLTPFLDRLYENESIIYIGLFKNRELIYLLSRFEGFFPVVPGKRGNRILDTPMGKVFEVTGYFNGTDKADYGLYIGFDYEFLTAFEQAAGRNMSLIAGLFLLLMGLVMGLVVYFNKKVFNKELELMREKQEKERFKELSLLTSEIAHEIKNPLNSIYLSFNNLEKHFTQHPDALFYRDAVKDEIRRVSGILESYSELSSDVRPHLRGVNVTDLANEFRLLMSEELKVKGVTLNVAFNVALGQIGSTQLFTDPDLLKQILLNLVKNAMEAGASVIGVSLERESGTILLRVEDNGRGVAEELRDSIFKPYISSKTKGTGLGLHITLKLVRALQGEITLVCAEPGQTVFQVRLIEGKN